MNNSMEDRDFTNVLLGAAKEAGRKEQPYTQMLLNYSKELISDVCTKASMINKCLIEDGTILMKNLSEAKDPEQRDALMEDYKNKLYPLTDALAQELQTAELLSGQSFMGVKVPEIDSMDSEKAIDDKEHQVLVDKRTKAMLDFSEKLLKETKASIEKEFGMQVKENILGR